MNSRMEKYNSVDYGNMSRLKKNESTYNNNNLSELSRIKTNNNVSIISDAHREIDIDKIRKYISDINDKEEIKHRVSLELPKEEKITVVRKEEKNYDINSILEHAKDSRETNYDEDRHRKISSTQIDILKNIKIKEEEKHDIDEDTTGPIEELNTEEKTLVELINNIQSNKQSNKKELFDELMSDGDDDTVVAPINDETSIENFKEELFNMTQDLENIKEPENDFTKEINIELEKLKSQDNESNNNDEENDDEPKADKSFYTNSITFDKSDFEGFEELEKEAQKSGFFTKFMIFIIIVLLLGTVFMIVNYVFDLNLLF